VLCVLLGEFSSLLLHFPGRLSNLPGFPASMAFLGVVHPASSALASEDRTGFDDAERVTAGRATACASASEGAPLADCGP